MTTALKIKKEDGTEERLQFMTTPHTDGGVAVDLWLCDEDWIPKGQPSLGYSHQEEVQYHIDLRKQASEKGQLVPDFCTDPEFSPGYIKPEEDEMGSNTDSKSS